MNHFRSLRTAMVVFVFGIMLVSTLLTGLCVVFLSKAAWLSPLLDIPFILPIIALFVSTLIGTVISIFYSKTVIKPLKELGNATKQIAKGDFSVRVKENGTDNEINKLIVNFNSMTEELESTELMKKDFISMFSHEFKTPIVSIRGFARELQNENLSAEERKEYTDIIISESERMSRMSGNILLLTKLENQHFVSGKSRFSLDEQIRDCILLLETQWQKKDIEWSCELDDIDFFGNEELLTHLWVNLIGNAIKYSEHGGLIEVRCRAAADKVTVIIADHGEGIAEKNIKHIFDKFYQADSSHSAEGNGLGLCIVRSIVELYGGHITVESALGKGTAFYVELPIESKE